MARCGNCGATLSCSCKMRKASNGKSCCVNCISNYERTLKQSTKQSADLNKFPGTILNATAVQKK